MSSLAAAVALVEAMRRDELEQEQPTPPPASPEEPLPRCRDCGRPLAYGAAVAVSAGGLAHVSPLHPAACCHECSRARALDGAGEEADAASARYWARRRQEDTDR